MYSALKLVPLLARCGSQHELTFSNISCKFITTVYVNWTARTVDIFYYISRSFGWAFTFNSSAQSHSIRQRDFLSSLPNAMVNKPVARQPTTWLGHVDLFLCDVLRSFALFMALSLISFAYD